jgi:hypothetical protein
MVNHFQLSEIQVHFGHIMGGYGLLSCLLAALRKTSDGVGGNDPASAFLCDQKVGEPMIYDPILWQLESRI